MIKVFLIVVACQMPNYTLCEWKEVLEQPDSVTCQQERIPSAAAWVEEYRAENRTNWAIFTRCKLLMKEGSV